jgi:hypothetical protein
LESGAPDFGGDVGAGGLLAQGVDEGIEVDGVDGARGTVHGIFYYLNYFADIEDYVASEPGRGEEFENSCWLSVYSFQT